MLHHYWRECFEALGSGGKLQTRGHTGGLKSFLLDVSSRLFPWTLKQINRFFNVCLCCRERAEFDVEGSNLRQLIKSCYPNFHCMSSRECTFCSEKWGWRQLAPASKMSMDDLGFFFRPTPSSFLFNGKPKLRLALTQHYKVIDRIR